MLISRSTTPFKCFLPALRTGNKGLWEVWLDESNSWIYPHLHTAARRMTECARAAKERPTEEKEALRPSDRQLFLDVFGKKD